MDRQARQYRFVETGGAGARSRWAIGKGLGLRLPTPGRGPDVSGGRSRAERTRGRLTATTGSRAAISRQEERLPWPGRPQEMLAPLGRARGGDGAKRPGGRGWRSRCNSRAGGTSASRWVPAEAATSPIGLSPRASRHPANQRNQVRSRRTFPNPRCSPGPGPRGSTACLAGAVASQPVFVNQGSGGRRTAVADHPTQYLTTLGPAVERC